MDLSKDYYEILGVSPTIEPEALKAVFRALSKNTTQTQQLKPLHLKGFKISKKRLMCSKTPNYVKIMIKEN